MSSTDMRNTINIMEMFGSINYNHIINDIAYEKYSSDLNRVTYDDIKDYMGGNVTPQDRKQFALALIKLRMKNLDHDDFDEEYGMPKNKWFQIILNQVSKNFNITFNPA